MLFKSQHEFDARPEAVFDAMTNPDVVAACLPGCEGLHPVGENRYEATLTVGVAAIKGRFRGTVELRDLRRPSSYALRVNGRGSIGFAKGEARIAIEAHGNGSLVSVESNAQVGGAVARVGQRLLAGTAKTVADKFFASLREHVDAETRQSA